MAFIVAGGLLLTAIGASAAELTAKVSGLLRKDITILVKGEKSDLQPVFMEGRAYIPARDAAEAFNYVVSWNEPAQTIVLWDVDRLIQMEGVVVKKTSEGDGAIGMPCKTDRGQPRIKIGTATELRSVIC